MRRSRTRFQTKEENYRQDAMGTVIGQADATGASTANFKYDGFGNIVSATGASAGIDPTLGSEPRFHGMMLDSATGLYYVRARYYDGQTGRFVEADSLGGRPLMVETYHPYTFSNSNPIVWRDPLGLFGLEEVGASVSISRSLSTMGGPSLGTWKSNIFGQSVCQPGTIDPATKLPCAPRPTFGKVMPGEPIEHPQIKFEMRLDWMSTETSGSERAKYIYRNGSYGSLGDASMPYTCIASCTNINSTTMTCPNPGLAVGHYHTHPPLNLSIKEWFSPLDWNNFVTRYPGVFFYVIAPEGVYRGYHGQHEYLGSLWAVIGDRGWESVF